MNIVSNIKGKSILYPPVIWSIYKLPTYGLETDTLPTYGPLCLLPLPIIHQMLKKKIQNNNPKKEKHSIQFSPSLTRFPHPPDSSLQEKIWIILVKSFFFFTF